MLGFREAPTQPTELRLILAVAVSKGRTLPPRNTHVPQDHRLLMDIEFVLFRFDQHGINDSLF